MNYPFDRYYNEKCKNCFNQRRCKKDNFTMLFCLLTESFERKPTIDFDKKFEKLRSRFRRKNKEAKTDE